VDSPRSAQANEPTKAAPRTASAPGPVVQKPVESATAKPLAKPAPSADDGAIGVMESVTDAPLVPTPAPPAVATKPVAAKVTPIETPRATPSTSAPAAAEASKPATDPKPVVAAKPIEGPEIKPETKPDAKAEAKPEAKTEAKPDAIKAGSPAGLPVKLEPQNDGSTLVDGKYVIKGAGTKEDPYRVTWEMLVSAEETYRPRLGKKVIPDRVKMLDGKWIRISGYIAFPVMAQSADEMLMMLNQWDGCCIGVPPTPYDAIEVKLKAAAKGNERLRTSGTLTGKLKVDPYLVKDWLISLYVMDDGELSDTKGTANPGMHAGGGGGMP
ncbi:MAG TPA: DUF3299 domain-containing protein, partial [Phycisphaerales bacterium]|nr:DUF3299 domain-containing protein [Phycisphaerales bacterium]